MDDLTKSDAWARGVARARLEATKARIEAERLEKVEAEVREAKVAGAKPTRVPLPPPMQPLDSSRHWTDWVQAIRAAHDEHNPKAEP